MKENWVRKHIADICDKASSNIAQNKLEGLNGDYPIYGASGYVQNVDFYHRDKAYIGVVKDGSGVGRVNVYPAYSSLLGTMQYILPKEGFSLQFVAYALKSLNLASFASGAAIPHIYFKDYGQCEILVPPTKEEQEQVVAELDLLSGVIDKQKAELKELDSLAQSTFYDMFGDPIENPKGWEVKKIGDVSTDVSYGTSSPSSTEGKYKYLRMNNITYEGFLDLTNLKYIDMDGAEFEKYSVREGDVLFNRTNSIDLVGKTTYIHDMEPMIIAGYIIRVRLADSVLPVYVSKFMNTLAMKKKLRSMAKGAVNQANINSKELKNIDIPVPPLSLQQEFADKIASIEKQKTALTQSIAESQKLLDYTMDKYFG